MKQRPRIYYTEEQKALMWERWQQGESATNIGRSINNTKKIKTAAMKTAVNMQIKIH